LTHTTIFMPPLLPMRKAFTQPKIMEYVAVTRVTSSGR